MATMVAITLFVPEVKPYLRGCPEVMAIAHIRHAAIEFCEKSRYWRENLTPFNSVAGTASYTLTPPTDALIWDVISVRHNGKDLSPAFEDDIDATSSSDWRSRTATDAESWFAGERDNIRLVPAPSSSGTANIEARVVVKPSRTTTNLPKQLYDNYLENIAAGAKARLMAMVDVEWSNPTMVNYHENIFMSGVTKATTEAAKGYNRARLRTRPISKRF